MASGGTITSGGTRRGPSPHLANGRSIWIGDPNIKRGGGPQVHPLATPPGNIFGREAAAFGQTMRQGGAHTPHQKQWSGPIWAAAGYGAEPPPAGSDTAAKVAAIYSNPLMVVLRLASTGISAYHGYKRNNSIGWALWWGFMGSMFPIVTPAIAFAQGIDKPKGR
jgi:hypothetical protein